MEIYMQQFKAEHIGQYLKLSLQAFKENNPRLTLGIVKDEHYLQSTEALIRQMMVLQEKFNRQNKTDIMFNVASFKDGKMVSAIFSCDLYFYIRQTNGKAKDLVLKQLSAINLNELTERSHIVSMKGFINKQLHNKRLATPLLIQRAKYLVSKGYVNQFVGVVNPKTISIVERFGGSIWKDLSFEWEGKKIPVYIMSRDLRVMANHNMGKL